MCVFFIFFAMMGEREDTRVDRGWDPHLFCFSNMWGFGVRHVLRRDVLSEGVKHRFAPGRIGTMGVILPHSCVFLLHGRGSGDITIQFMTCHGIIIMGDPDLSIDMHRHGG